MLTYPALTRWAVACSHQRHRARPLRYVGTIHATCPPLAAVARLSPFHFLRSFQAQYHATPQQVLMARRLALAKRLLTTGDRPAQVAAATGLTENVDTITENMTEYHAFRRIDPQTPAAILELGFLGGDNDLLANQQALLAKGVADGLLCFLDGGPHPTPEPTP